MELVSAAKMRRASEATLASRPYVVRAQEVVGDLLKKPITGLTHPLLADRPVKNILVFVVASDRTLAGAFNANVAKQTFHLLDEADKKKVGVEIITMGKQITRLLSRFDAPVIQSYTNEASHPSLATLEPISRTITEGFFAGKYDEVDVIYTDFRTLLTQEVRQIQLLPLHGILDENNLDERTFLYEPDPLQALNAILPRLLEAQLYQCIEESLASEHAARRMAMRSASDNASDMIDDLTLTYNGIRQDSITREIAEITAGANA